MGPDLRRDDGLEATGFKTVTPAQAGAYNPHPLAA